MGDVALCQRFADACHIAPTNVPCRQMVIRMVRMLHLCDYTPESIIMVLGLALVHLRRLFDVCSPLMADSERSCIAVLQCFNAHCYLMDEACPLKYWQQNIYRLLQRQGAQQRSDEAHEVAQV